MKIFFYLQEELSLPKDTNSNKIFHAFLLSTAVVHRMELCDIQRCDGTLQHTGKYCSQSSLKNIMDVELITI